MQRAAERCKREMQAEESGVKTRMLKEVARLEREKVIHGILNTER